MITRRQNFRGMLVGGALIAAMIGAPVHVHAGSCAPPQSEIIPRGPQVPTNPRILVLFPGPEATIYGTPLRITTPATNSVWGY